MYPYKRKLMQQFGGQGFTVLGVDCERHGNKDQARQMMQREEITWPNWWSPLSENRINKSWKVSESDIPNVTILDHRGIIRRRGDYSNPSSWPDLTQLIEQLLAERAKDLSTRGR
jgi:hypothetical protein